MTEKTYTIEGIAKWAKVYEPADNYSKEGKEWSIDIYPTPEGLATIKASGTAANPKIGDDGIFYKFKRPVQKIAADGRIIDFMPPAVVDQDKQPFSKLIGNGSKVLVAITVYQPKRADSRPGTRLESVQVLEHVEYNAEGGGPVEPKLPF